MKFKKYLNEGLVHGDFTFGFELEAISSSDFSDRDVLKSISSINKIWNKGKSIADATLVPDDPDEEFPFEYVSPVLQFNPKYLKNVIDLFDSLLEIGIYTNESCGLHFHMSFPTFSIEDGFWILINLSKDQEMLKKLLKLKKYNFFNKKYAEVKFLTEIKNLLKIYNTKDKLLKSTEGIEVLNKWNELFNTTKYRILRIHPQGTLEWRGPRNFLDNRKDVKEFFILLWNFVSWIIKTLNKKEIDNIQRKDFNEFLKKLETKSFKLNLSNFIEDYTVEKMVFTINRNNIFIWHSGIWYDGIWKDGVWKSGDWYDGIWKDGIWKSGRIYSEKYGKFLISKVNPIIFKELEKEINNLEEFKKILNKKIKKIELEEYKKLLN